VRYNDARPRTRLLSVVALIVTFSVVAIAAEWGLPWSDTPTAHPPHALAAAPGSEFAVFADHEHIRDGSTPTAPDTFTAAVLPRLTPVLVALALIAAVVVLAGSCGRAILAAGRGPPRALATVLTGQQILARFCISRR
jgi:amino acid transporter